MHNHDANQPTSLGASLAYEPKPLQFGTSGRRGLVVDLTQLEIYINALAELEYLQSLPPSDGGIIKGDVFYYAYDLRLSSTRFVLAEKGRGEIAQAIERAIRDAGMMPVNLGPIPTPALTFFAIRPQKGSIMITGSHIPFDRNGYKTNTSIGELLKIHEAPIQQQVERVRARLYEQPYDKSLFNAQGMFKAGRQELQPETEAARTAYVRRYTDFFAGKSLQGMRLLVYQHSAVGRDLLVEILERLGAEVFPAQRSDTFVPIDTENIEDTTLAAIEEMVKSAQTRLGNIDAVVSTDGDSDRPLVLGVENENGSNQVRFFGGDLVGMIVAAYLGADAIVVPITCNDAIDRGPLKDKLEPKTQIGSPFVIAGMEKAKAKGRQAVCGWEANGGFLTGSNIERDGRCLQALPTRDAILPLLGVLFSAVEKKKTLPQLFGELPKRYSRASLLRNFPRKVSLKILERFSPPNPEIKEAAYVAGQARCLDRDGNEVSLSENEFSQLMDIPAALSRYFSAADGFDAICKINWIDGLRVYFGNGEVAHVRPSGNAEELRIYAVADTQVRADAIIRSGVAEPDGILRTLEKGVAERSVPVLWPESGGLLLLEGAVQHYAWGGFQFIPALLHVENATQRPFAELWLGAHPKAPAVVTTNNGKAALDQLIRQNAAGLLGPAVAGRFDGQLPYLMKILDARQMLSIQAHPNKEQAARGYAREDAAGISLQSPQRNYQDDNHKPEVHVALTDFWMLHGFRPAGQIAATLESVPELSPLLPACGARLFHKENPNSLIKELYSRVMTMPQSEVDAILKPLIERLRQTSPSDKQTPEYWALRAADSFGLPEGHLDRGIFSIFLLNLLHLRPGQGTYQPAGLLHSYLEGVNVELMANSDNVLRGGLTPKHVDVEELMQVLIFEGHLPGIMEGKAASSTETLYSTPTEEFALSRIQVAPGQIYDRSDAHSADTLIVISGTANVATTTAQFEMRKGDAFLVPYGITCRIKAGSAPATLYKASIPRAAE